MNPVTKDVIRDLLPVYIAGEASADTSVLVEAYLKQDAELRALAESSRTPQPPLIPPTNGMEQLELKSLDHTRRLLDRRTWLLALSMFCTFVPMTCVWHGKQIVFLMARDEPVTTTVTLAVAFVGWIAYLDTCRRLSMTGLEPSRTWGARLRWALTGTLFGASTMIALRNWTGDGLWLRTIPVVCMILALRLGERWRQIAPRV